MKIGRLIDMANKKFTWIKRLAWCLGIALVLCTACTTMVMWKHRPLPSKVAAGVQRDVVYSQVTGMAMDIYFPSNATAGRRPVVMYIHGGGWKMGNKSMLALMPGPSELLRRGYVVTSIDYRLAPQYKFPAMLDDAKDALRFLRRNAEMLNLDTHRIGVMGDSAGGHLASLLALTGVDKADGESTRVQAVVDLYGPSDFTGGDMHASKMTIRLLQDAFGATNANDPVLKAASPVTYIASQAPPFLILHGDHDGLVDLKQSVELNARLKAAGDESTLLVITNYAHGYTPLGLTASPNMATLSQIVADFFDRYLR